MSDYPESDLAMNRYWNGGEWSHGFFKFAAAMEVERNQLRARVAELEADKARLDWLENKYANLRISEVIGSEEKLLHVWDARRVRSLNDAAMSAIQLEVRKMVDRNDPPDGLYGEGQP